MEYSIVLSQLTAECFVTPCTLAVMNCNNQLPPLFLLYQLPLANSTAIISAMFLTHSRMKAITLVKCAKIN